MEITINRNTLYGILVLVALLALLGLGAIGRPVTPVTADGNARLLTWNDWQILKAERRYNAERELLRADVNALASLLNQAPDPVSAQLLAQRIATHTADGEAALLPARTALQQAAQDVANWTAGALDRELAVASLLTAVNLLK
jgi:YD repeat-containing protein